MNTSFQDLNLSTALIEGLAKQNITEPTEIQQKALPVLLENKDFIGQSVTGSGKTLAYLLPMFTKIDPSKREMQGLILAPTHELVMQIINQIKLLAQNSEIPMTCTSLIGEANINNQIKFLKDKPHILVGTPGRVMDLLKKKKINAHTIKTIVIDEGDSMLDPTNSHKVKEIIKCTQRDRQLMTFSASINNTVLKVCQELMKDPVIVKCADNMAMNPNIEHYCIVCEQRDKFEQLRKLINAVNPEKAIIFLNNGENIDFITEKLNYHKKKAFAMYGVVSKEERKQAMEGLRKGTIQLLIASDVAARGLDIPDVTHIFTLDSPLDYKEYLHRAGRTARGNRTGTCINIVTEREIPALRIYQREFDIKIKPIKVSNGKMIVLPGELKSTKKPKSATTKDSKPKAKEKKKPKYPDHKPKKVEQKKAYAHPKKQEPKHGKAVTKKASRINSTFE